MTTPINIKVSPALDPETVFALEGYTEETASFVGTVFSAFNDAYLTIGKLHEAAALWRGNSAVTPEAGVLMVSKEAAKQQDRLLRGMDSALRSVEANIVHAEAELSKPLEARALGTLNAEIRQHFRGLSREDRSKLIREAMEADDETTLSSLLAVPAYLSGLSEIDRSHHLHRFHSRKNPGMVARLTVLRAARDKIDRDGRLVIKEIRKAIGADATQVQAIDKADAAARAALNIAPAA